MSNEQLGTRPPVPPNIPHARALLAINHGSFPPYFDTALACRVNGNPCLIIIENPSYSVAALISFANVYLQLTDFQRQ